MSPQAIIALTTALLGLAACDNTSAGIDAAIKRLTQDDAQQAKDLAEAKQTLALYTQVSSQAKESTSSSSSIAASQEVAEQPVATPEPPKEPCTTGAFRLYDCVDGWRVYW
jgi:hypothetical protein